MKTIFLPLVIGAWALCLQAIAQPSYLSLNRLGTGYSLSQTAPGFNTGSGPAGESVDRDQPKTSFFADVNLGLTSFYNKSINKSSNWDPKSGYGYQVHVGYQRRLERIKHLFAFGFGIGISSYGMDLSSVDTVRDEIYNQIDRSTGTEPDTCKIYTAKMNYYNILEKTRLTYLDVPLFIEFGNQSTNKVGFFVKVEVKLSYNISDVFNGSGNYRETAYYPAYKIELPAIPGLLRFDTALYTGQKNYKVNKFNVSAAISAGITIPLSSRWVLMFGPRYETGLLGINSTSGTSDQDYKSNFNHYLETTTAKTFTRALGFEIGIHNVRSIF